MRLGCAFAGASAAAGRLPRHGCAAPAPAASRRPRLARLGLQDRPHRRPQAEPDQQHGDGDDGDGVDEAAESGAAAARRCRSTAPARAPGRSAANSTAATVMRSPRLASMPAADATRRSTSFSCLSTASGAGVLAQRRQQPLAVDHHGDGQALDLVALADGRGGLGAHLVVGELLATLVGALRLVAAELVRRLLGRDVLLDADGGAVGCCSAGCPSP